MRLKHYCLFLFIIIFQFAKADLNYSFRSTYSTNGLSQSSVLSMVQDDKGFLWIGTKDGLNRYDGYEFVVYKYNTFDKNTISNNEISSLAVQDDKFLWIGTRSGGINRLELSTGTIERYSNLTYDDLVRGIYHDPNGKIWAGTSEGLFLYNESDDGIGDFINVSANAKYFDHNGERVHESRKNITVVSILYLDDKTLLVGAEEGLFEYKIEKNSFQFVSEKTMNKSVYTKIIKDSRGYIWASSYDGVFRLLKNNITNSYNVVEYSTTQTNSENKLSVNWVEDIVEDFNGNIWLATRGSGVVIISNDKIAGIYDYSPESESSIPDNLINSLIIDRTGVLWVGTESNELLKTDLFAKRFKTVKSNGKNNNGISDNLVTAITGFNNKLWVGTSANGIDIFDINQYGELTKSRNIPKVWSREDAWKGEIQVLLCDSLQNLWIGNSTNSLIKYRNNSFDSYVTDGYIFALMEDDRGNIWFGTWGQGVGYINKKSSEVVQFNGEDDNFLNLGSDKALSLFLDSEQLLWVGTKGGGVSVAPIENIISRKGTFSTFLHDSKNPHSLSYNDVYDIFEDSNGNMWFATGSGVNKLEIDRTKKREEQIKSISTFQEINEQEGLPGGLVYTITSDDCGSLWFGTNKGLSQFDIESNEVINFIKSDGLSSEKFNYNSAWKNPESGVIYMGGVDGLTYFYPDSILTNPYDANVSITRLKINNKEIEPNSLKKYVKNNIAYTEDITLSYWDNEILFEFSALHFSNPEKNRYAYRLVGFNDNWQEVNSYNRRATYTNLRFGEYEFQVKATNNDGVMSDKVETLKMKILPPFWLTTWAYLVYIAVFVMLLIVFRKYSLIAVTKKNQFIIENIEHRKEAEIAEAKMRFFTNISHEIRTPLTLIKAPLEQLIKKEDPLSENGQIFAMMHRSVKRLINQVEQLLELRKMEKGHYKLKVSQFEIEQVFETLVPEFDNVIEHKNIEVKYDYDKDYRTLINGDKHLIETVFYNLLSNSLKFSPEDSSISIMISKPEERDDNMVSIKICDEGPGIPEDEINTVFNRFYKIDTEENSHFGGSGIGLSIVKEFVDQHFGEVKAYNLEERGCCFEVVLPIIPVQKDDEISKGDGNITAQTDDADLADGASDEDEAKNPKLWIIEDDVDLSFYLSNHFSENFEISTYNNGLKAFESLESNTPDIIICDIMLPGMDGVEFTKRLKEDETTSHIPVIILTARTEDDKKVESLNIGADSYFVKPFSTDVLEAQVNSLIKSRELYKSQYSKQMVLAPTEEVLTTSDEKFLTNLKKITEERMSDSSFEVSNLIEEMNMSHPIILKKVKDLTGMSLVEFIRTMRIQKAAQIFRQDKLTVSEVGYMVGFSDPKYFSKCFTREIGKKPTEYIKEYHP